LACLGRHTVTGLLCACGRQFPDWSADYRLFSKDRWEAKQLFVPVLRGLLDMLRPIAPVGYRPRQGSKLLYREPAYLICTDLDLPLGELLQYYLWRWDMEVNPREEKQIIGVGQAQVWSEQSVERQPAFAVAGYAMLLLAAARALGPDATHGTLPPPKWQSRRDTPRVSTQDLIQQLRSEVWAYALDQMEANSDDFATTPPAGVKSLKLEPPELPVTAALLYARTG
jgi:hypothetical protein